MGYVSFFEKTVVCNILIFSKGYIMPCLTIIRSSNVVRPGYTTALVKSIVIVILTSLFKYDVNAGVNAVIFSAKSCEDDK